MVLRYSQNELFAMVTENVNLVTDVLRAGLPSMRKRFSCGQEQMRQQLRGGWSDMRATGNIVPAPTIHPARMSHPGFVGNCG
jgi:hypothetical protein